VLAISGSCSLMLACGKVADEVGNDGGGLDETLDSSSDALAVEASDALVVEASDALVVETSDSAVESFFTQVAAAECAAQNACPIGQTEAAYVRAACATQASYEVATEAAELAASVDAGRMRFDPSAVAACLAGIPSAPYSCANSVGLDPFSFPDPLDLCPGVFAGIVADGGPCASQLDCATGICSNGQNYHSGLAATNDLVWEWGLACLGTCQPFFTLGQACGEAIPPGQVCAAGLWCVSGLCMAPSPPSPLGGPCSMTCNCCAEGYCAVNGTCMAYQTQGQPCSPSDGCLGSICCAPGLQCSGTGDAGVCATAPLPVAGEPCGPYGSCALPLVCVGYGTLSDGGLEAGTCAVPHDVGGSCVPATGEGASSSGCLTGLNCVNGTCQVPTSTGACVSDYFSFSSMLCGLSSFCDPVTMTCQPLLPLGASCTSVFGNYALGDVNDCEQGLCDSTGHCSLTNCAN